MKQMVQKSVNDAI